jgi:hypothetical protein
MNPSIDVRIDSMIRALSDFVIPELDAGGTGAGQAALVLGHLHVLRGQVDLAGPFEKFELTTSLQLASELLAVAAGGERTESAMTGLRAAVAGASDHDPVGVRSSTETLRGNIEDLIRASAVDGDPAVSDQLQTIVLGHERGQADANRSLFAGMSWESGETDLPDLHSLLFTD